MNVVLWFAVVVALCGGIESDVYPATKKKSDLNDVSKNEAIDHLENNSASSGLDTNSIQSTSEGQSFKEATPSSGTSDATTDQSNGISDDTTDQKEGTTDSTTDLTSTTDEDAEVATIKVDACPEIPPVDFTIEAKSFDVTLTWNGTEPTCVDHYSIQISSLDEDFQRDFNTANLTLTIDELYACSEYNLSLEVVNDGTAGPPTQKTFRTTIPEDFSSYPVGDLYVSESVDDEKVIVEWGRPAAKVFHCVTSYFLVWWDDETEDKTHRGETNIPADELNTTLPLVGCMQYGIEIYPKAGESKSGLLKITSYTAGAYPSDPPTLVQGSIRTSKVSVNATWTRNAENSKCELNELVTTCVAPEDENHEYQWVIWNGYTETPISDDQIRYSISVENLSPFTNYSCQGVIENIAGNSSTTNFTIRTQEDVPPDSGWLNFTDVSSYNFTVEWAELKEVPGILLGYGLKIENFGPQDYNPRTECWNNFTDSYLELQPYQTSYIFTDARPYYRFTVSLYGFDSAGNGPAITRNITTPAAVPDSVMNPKTNFDYSETESYDGVAIVSFEPPCNTNGPFKHYQMNYIGTRDGFETINYTDVTSATEINIKLRPEYDYNVSITVVTEEFESTPVSYEFHSNSGVPPLYKPMSTPTADDTSASFTLSRDSFSNENGEIIAYSLFLLTSIRDPGFGFWEDWPPGPKNSKQLTPNLWNPFKNGVETITFIIGKDETCSQQNFCNEPLEEDTRYYLLVRALTKEAYKDASLLEFQTEMHDNALGLILGLIFGFLAVLALIIVLIFLWRRRGKPFRDEHEQKTKPRSSSITPNTTEKFLIHYNDIKANPEKLTHDFFELGKQSKEEAGVVTFANLPENKRKNRYTNILPFDATRVKLQIDEDDEISSDYINASYIKGYSQKIEYIATQGPLESTVRDFWKMIIQENVSIIAMVSQFVEQSKEKCFQYFPSNHETAKFGESLEVKCATELHFGTYCVRTLQVRKGNEQREVSHMQFLEWPDFGVPQGTDNMLQFCSQLREKANKEGGLILVHCSAGVGRTGTLIALDILFQTIIDDHREIAIKQTVLNLRKQRTNMVQTESQYMFIHTCVKDYIEDPPALSNNKEAERIYENVDMLRSSSIKKNLIDSELESAL